MVFDDFLDLPFAGSFIDSPVPSLVGLPVNSVIGSFCIFSVLYIPFLVRFLLSSKDNQLCVHTNIHNEL